MNTSLTKLWRLFKGGKYSREETVGGNIVFENLDKAAALPALHTYHWIRHWKSYIYSKIYSYASLISVSDVDFFANVGKVPLPKISPSGKNTKEVQTFIDEFIEGTSLNPNNESIGADDGIEAPKKNVSITKFKEFLEENKGWTEWKFLVKIQISIEKQEQSSKQSRPSRFRLIL